MSVKGNYQTYSRKQLASLTSVRDPITLVGLRFAPRDLKITINETLFHRYPKC